MTNTYDTAAEPLGTTSVKAFYNNVSNLDDLMLGPAQYYPDRKGVNRLSWAGIEQQFRNFLVNSGYEVPVPYVAGIAVTRPTQTFSYLGEIYRPKVASIPFTTTTFAADSDKLLAMGDAALRGQLSSTAAGNGASLVARSLTVVNSVAEARLLSKLSPSQFVMTTGYYAAGDGGNAWYRFNQADGSTPDDGAGTLVTADGGRLNILQSPEMNARQCGAKGDNSTVDRLRIQAGIDYAVSKGWKTFAINDGIFILEQSLLTSPNLKLHGNGTLKAAQTGFTGVINAPFSAPGAAFTRPLVRNKGFFAGSISDENIFIEGLTFDYGSLVLSGGGCHAISMRHVRTVRVKNCTILNGEDATAFLGCDDTLVEGCTARNFSNCAYDHWDSPKNARLVNCYAGTSSSVQMVNFNPEPTAGETAQGLIADGFAMLGCILEYNGATGSFCQLEPLVDGNGARNITVVGNILRNVSLAIRRNTSNVSITGNNFVGGVATNTNPAIMCNVQGVDTPTSVVVANNTFVDWRTSAANLGVIQMMCNGYSVTGNTVSGTLHYAAMYVGAYTGRQAGNYFFPGTSGQEVIGAGGTPPWVAIGLTNSWQNSATSGEANASYKVFTDQRKVVCRGSIKLGTLNTAAFVMPAFLAPESVARRAVVSNGAFGWVLIGTDGSVVPVAGSNAQFSLDGVEWYY